MVLPPSILPSQSCQETTAQPTVRLGPETWAKISTTAGDSPEIQVEAPVYEIDKLLTKNSKDYIWEIFPDSYIHT